MTPLVGISPESALDCSWRDGVLDGPLVEVAPGEEVSIVPRVDQMLRLLDLFVMPDCAAYFDVHSLVYGRMPLLQSITPAQAFDLTRSQRIANPFGSAQIDLMQKLTLRVRNVTSEPRKFRAYFSARVEWGY